MFRHVGFFCSDRLLLAYAFDTRLRFNGSVLHKERNMLVLSRKSRESIQIGGSVVVTVLEIRGNKVRLGIDAPKEVHVLRTELHDGVSGASGAGSAPRSLRMSRTITAACKRPTSTTRQRVSPDKPKAPPAARSILRRRQSAFWLRQDPQREREILMPMTTVSAPTPHYVLLYANRRIGPKVTQVHPQRECSPIYGFSDRGAYDRFCANSELVLQPYPLVTGYLRNQIDALGDCLKLVVLDASSPSEPDLQAATMEAVLEVHENRASEVNAGYRLTLDEESDGYRVEEAPR